MKIVFDCNCCNYYYTIKKCGIENGTFREGRVWFDFHAVMTFSAWRLCFFVHFYSHCGLGQKAKHFWYQVYHNMQKEVKDVIKEMSLARHPAKEIHCTMHSSTWCAMNFVTKCNSDWIKYKMNKNVYPFTRFYLDGWTFKLLKFSLELFCKGVRIQNFRYNLFNQISAYGFS